MTLAQVLVALSELVGRPVGADDRARKRWLGAQEPGRSNAGEQRVGRTAGSAVLTIRRLLG